MAQCISLHTDVTSPSAGMQIDSRISYTTGLIQPWISEIKKCHARGVKTSPISVCATRGTGIKSVENMDTTAKFLSSDE